MVIFKVTANYKKTSSRFGANTMMIALMVRGVVMEKKVFCIIVWKIMIALSSYHDWNFDH